MKIWNFRVNDDYDYELLELFPGMFRKDRQEWLNSEADSWKHEVARREVRVVKCEEYKIGYKMLGWYSFKVMKY